MANKLKDKYTVTVVILLLIQLVILYYLKYDNQNLPLSEFSLSFKGNIFNLAVTLALMLGFILLPKVLLQKKLSTF